MQTQTVVKMDIVFNVFVCSSTPGYKPPTTPLFRPPTTTTTQTTLTTAPCELCCAFVCLCYFE